MTREEELTLVEHRLDGQALPIWNTLEKQTMDLWRDLEHVRMTTLAIFVVTGNEPGRPDQRIHAVATVTDASIPPEQIDMILSEAQAVYPTTSMKEVNPQ